MNRFLILGLIMVLILGSMVACGDGTGERNRKDARSRPLILTTFYPVTYFCTRLVGEAAEVRCPLPEDADPIFWQPDDAQLAAYVDADLVVANGAHFERWMNTAGLPESRLVLSAAPLEQELIEIPGVTTHSHGGRGAHSHAGIDGHTWVDPENARRQVVVIRDALQRLLPAERNAIDRRAEALDADLAGLAAELATICKEAAAEKRPILASHPAYNYLARREGLNLKSLDLDPGEMPDETSLAALAQAREGFPARAILWESAPAEAIAARLRQDFGLESFVFSPCEMLASSEQEQGRDYLTVMRANLANLRAALALRAE